MIDNLDDFHYYVGRTIIHCQTIEHDMQLIYAGIKSGDMDDNLDMISKNKMTLGIVLKNLQLVDRSDDNWFFSDGDYELLKQITKILNHWAHHAYCDFLYSNKSCDFVRQARRLENDHNRLEKLSKTIESVRLKVLRKYGRI